MCNRFLHLPVTLRTRRYCFLAHLVLVEVVLTMSMPGNWFLHLPVALRTHRCCFPAHLVLGEVVTQGELLKDSKCLNWWKIILSAWWYGGVGTQGVHRPVPASLFMSDTAHPTYHLQISTHKLAMYGGQ